VPLILFGLAARGQMVRPDPPLPLCRDYACLEATEGVRSLDLRKRYKKEQAPPITRLKEITWLDLSANRLRTLPEWVCECTQLEYLELSRNQLYSLPDCIGNMKRLRYLSVNRNPLASLPASLAYCDSLEYLDLWQTWIDYLPPELKKLNGTLRTVDLRDIRMTMEQQMEIRKVLPDPEVRMSAWCNCIPHRNKER
jgi:hypothetical protein